MVNNIKELKYHCPFCNNSLASRFSKCFNVYCQGQNFNVGNLVLYRLNPDLGIGRIRKKLEIPASKTLDDEDTFFITKFKVHFENNIIKTIHPIDLIHYIFSINERILTKQGVVTVNSNDFLVTKGNISYEIVYSNGKVTQIDESDIISKYRPSLKKIIFKQLINPPENFLIKYWANLFHSYYTSYQIKCITNSRLSLMPHQINVAYRLSEEYFPRVILADEVGLGKTIEAGIFIKELMARNIAERILIIVPATLVKQWQFEMQNKFNVEFTIYDGKKVKDLLNKGNYKSSETFQNPFYYDNLIICSLQFARSQKYIEYLSQISWDIVIFDEAHHLRRYLLNATTGNYRETLNYELARNLSKSTDSLLLLTATPLQLHSFELFSLIELIQREAFDNFSDFEHFRKNMPFINLLVSNINQVEKLNNFEVKNTIKLLKGLGYVNKKKEDSQILEDLKLESFKINLLKKIEKDHTLSKFLIRNRKKNVISKDFLNERIVKTIMVNPTKEELDIYNEIRLYLAKIYNSALANKNIGIGFIISTLQKLLTSSKYAFLKSLERRLEQIDRLKNLNVDLKAFKEEDPEFFESELEHEYLDSEISGDFENILNDEKEDGKLDLINQEKILKEFYEKLKEISYDSKCEKLIDLINQIHKQNPNEKVLIFTQFVDTLFYLKELLEDQKRGYKVELFYGGINKEEKDQAVERFRTNSDFSILLSTEIGGEGRNFQFCRILINYDLPWNPMKLEQRIGRLDRIGQKSSKIFIYNFFLEGTIETDIVFALDKRIHLFEESIGQLEPILGKIEREFKDIIFTEDEGKKRKKLNEFNRKLDFEVKKVKEIEMQLDDLMIDKKSFQMDDLIFSIASCHDVKLSHNELFLLMKYFFNLNNQEYGVLKNLNHDKSNFQNNIISPIKIQIYETLQKKLGFTLPKEFSGTFDLNLAREREEIDFFALGHPLINSILDYCRTREFRGFFTILNLKSESLPNNFKLKLINTKEVYLFIFNIKFQGFIIENQFLAVIVDKRGVEIENMADYVLDIENFQKIFDFNEKFNRNFKIERKFIKNLTETAKSIVKGKTTLWKKDIKALNDKIFDLEKGKKEKLYNYKRKVLNTKLETLSQKLERKKSNVPTEKQMSNILNMKDEKRKQQRLTKVTNLKEEISFIEKDLKSIEKKVDDLAFEYEDLKNEMNRRNLAKFYTNLNSLAIIRLID
ncbi:MAG: helicase-related protein [Candidatus Thorarchaeota archaeon]